ncbi:Nif3-like dinuclear metal center hexameric protein [Anoxybacter fermentans]|uniref:GTP cyclohydrolase 1 type 2 homolog n=1 Tax=Anoxybacter fermentans TaxID=1323375 RepID=A0A3Q9HQI1_9FIRM|nr:Nif3-like dinuclear metal center hexameric protein [Anoxybacter fermentans]AZR73123.1 Nif3-like dinuclear metal center hexameric protein [Anoxybacter fermentans]
MAEKVQRIVDIINRIAPPHLAESWDNVGLLVGDYSAEVDKVMVTLDVTEEVLDNAIEQDVKLIIAHHPMIFSEIKSIRADQPIGRLIIKAIQNGVNIFAAHTNLDIASGGINDLLAEKLELVEVKPLSVSSTDNLYKIVVYIPAGHEEEIRNALCEAGAGWIGKYSHCTFQASGTGTFKPLEGTNPFIGRKGELEKVKEVRLETIVPESRLNRAIKAMLKCHPYEEVAYDIYPLKNKGEKFGPGRIGYLPEPIPYREIIEKIKQNLNLPYLRYLGDLDRIIHKVALCGGSGASLIHKAAFQGADLYLTGDIKHHDARLAESLGLALIDAGHYWTEVVCVAYLYNVLKEEIDKESLSIELVQFTDQTDPFVLYK